jgi:transmembrane sensor
MSNPVHPPIDQEIASQAAEWILCFQEGAPDEYERARFERWREQSPMHAAAWARAERLLAVLGQVPPQFGRDSLRRVQRLNRRQMLRALGALLVVGPAAWTASRQVPLLRADLRTARGERRAVTLADGSRLTLNTASAVDMVFTADARVLRLHAGEILVVTHVDPAPAQRRFIVETAQGTVRALGTRFSVRRGDGQTRVAVFEHAVEITPTAGPAMILRSGEQTTFNAAAVAPAAPVAATAALWERGLFAAHQIRLADLAVEIGRYRSGVVRCHPAVADMRVSGTFPIGNDDAALRLLEKTLPLRVSSLGRYWITIEPLVAAENKFEKR